MAENILTVTQLTKQIKNALESSIPSPLKVTGEISNWNRSSSGHTYFSLKDETALIKCVIWKSTPLKREFKDGEKIILSGYISLYEPQGSYQIIARSIELSGQGELYAQFLKIKEKLEKEGLFDIEKKKKLPLYPLSIGIITSSTGSVIQDIENILKRRAPYVKKFLYPASVQGETSVRQLISGIKYFNINKVDVIIIARGGGSIEDLWSFNNEELAYAIFNSDVPIISAVGHETDFTIADFTASLRAPTPSAAAEIAVKDKKDTEEFLRNTKKEMHIRVNQNSLNLRQELSHLKQGFYISALIPINRKRDLISFIYKEMEENISSKLKYIKDILFRNSVILERHNPAREVEKKSSQLKEHRASMKNISVNLISSMKNNLKSDKLMLDALNPLNVMKRGYALVYNEKDNIITEKSMIKENQSLKISLRDGYFRSKVTSTKEE